LASETFVSAMMLITAVVASAILITAVFPIVWNMVSTFSSASHETDTRMRTDFKIVTTYACGTGGVTCSPQYVSKVWIKNIGTNRIGWAEVNQSDVFIGLVGNFDRATLDLTIWPPSNDKTWAYRIADTNGNGFWDTGETLEVDAYSSSFIASGQSVYFQFVHPNGVWRSSEFTTS
jgi:flagellar protein FlaG